MNGVARFSERQRSELFSQTAANMKTTPAVVEKDFWVTWVLGKLFEDTELGKILMFKGGTSLSKVYGLIERFSEDIDLIIDWQKLTEEDPTAERSRTKQQRLNDVVNVAAGQFLRDQLLPRLRRMTDGLIHCAMAADDLQVINVSYPAAFSDTYLRPGLRLEIGPLASWVPFEERTISCYAAQEFPDVFDTKECSVNVITAKRTFWEKATILHAEAHRTEGSRQPPRYSRHYYDLFKMMGSHIKDAALSDLKLLDDVVRFKKQFYYAAWAQYDLAKPGTLRLVPDGHVLAAVDTDYKAMREMIFGDVPTFDEILSALRVLENEINA